MFDTADCTIEFCVLASGSRGNCSVLRITADGQSRCVLIDCGLSPRRTLELLRDLNISPESITDCLLTHLDHDHVQLGWINALPDHTVLHLSKRHLGRAERRGILYRKSRPFDSEIHLHGGGVVHPLMMSHDDLGVAVFKFCLPNAACLGFATDLGRVSQTMLDHFRGVDVLAIESNYCPDMQRSSSRPLFLKRRIMNGGGHLSNQQCFDAVRAIAPRTHVVLLHLSQECNHPNLTHNLHAGSEYSLTIARQDLPTPWIPIRPAPNPVPAAPRACVQHHLFLPLATSA